MGRHILVRPGELHLFSTHLLGVFFMPGNLGSSDTLVTGQPEYLRGVRSGPACMGGRQVGRGLYLPGDSKKGGARQVSVPAGVLDPHYWILWELSLGVALCSCSLWVGLPVLAPSSASSFSSTPLWLSIDFLLGCHFRRWLVRVLGHGNANLGTFLLSPGISAAVNEGPFPPPTTGHQLLHSTV